MLHASSLISVPTHLLWKPFLTTVALSSFSILSFVWGKREPPFLGHRTFTLGLPLFNSLRYCSSSCPQPRCPLSSSLPPRSCPQSPAEASSPLWSFPYHYPLSAPSSHNTQLCVCPLLTPLPSLAHGRNNDSSYHLITYHEFSSFRPPENL